MTLFDDQINIDENKDYFVELVGEDKKFKTPQDLAKGKAESDLFIDRLQTENAELRKDLKAITTLAELTDKWALMQKQQTDPQVFEDNQSQKTVSEALTPEKLESILNSKLSEHEKLKVRQTNASFVREELKKTFGDRFSSKLKTELDNLGLTEEQANKMAEEQPKAFLRLFQGSSGKSDSFQSPPKSAINAPFMPNTVERTQKHYDLLREQNPNLYWSPKVQNQLHDDAIRLGERFFDT